jgi:alpha-tubulin suppressor-like RCC1 family protein
MILLVKRLLGLFLICGLVGEVLANPSVVAWGEYWNGEECVAAEVLENLDDVVEVSTGWVHHMALQRNGKVTVWGENFCGQTDVPPGLTNVIQIAAGNTHCLALREDASLAAWGGNDFGQLAVPDDLDDFVAVSAGDGHSLALRENGKVAAWGWNERGQADVPATLGNVVAIAAGGYHSVALRGDGVVIAWGGAVQLDGNPYLPGRWTDVVAIAAGTNHSLALRAGGKVEGWGENDLGQTDVPAAAMSGVVAIAAGGHRSVAVKEDGSLVIWGDAHDELKATELPAHVGGFSLEDSHLLALQSTGSPFVQTQMPRTLAVAEGKSTFLHASAIGTPPLDYQWKRDGIEIPGATSPTFLIDSVSPSDGGVYTLEVTNEFGVTTSGSGRLNVAGRAPLDLRQWKNVSEEALDVPNGLTSAVAIASGWMHTLALREDGTVIGWGLDSTPADVPDGLTNVIAVAAGEFHSMALKSDRTVAIWGYSEEEGDPVLPAGLNDVVALACNRHFLALKSDGTVVAWGVNTDGQTDVPNGLREVVAISAGLNDSLALKADGTVVGWGATPVPDGLSGIVAIESGENDGLALKTDGTVVAWGPFPGNVPDGLSNVVAIHSIGGTSFALQDDGSLATWTSSPFDSSRFPPSLTIPGIPRFEVTADGQFTITIDTSHLVPVGKFHSVAPRPLATVVLMGELPPSRNPVLGPVIHQGDAFSVLVPTLRGRVYRIEYKNSLDETSWKGLPLVPGNGSERPLSDFDIRDRSERYYRVTGW